MQKVSRYREPAPGGAGAEGGGAVTTHIWRVSTSLARIAKAWGFLFKRMKIVK